MPASGACSYVLHEFNSDNSKKIEDAEFIEIKSIPSNPQECSSFDSSQRVVIMLGVSKAWGAEVDFYAMLDQKSVPKGNTGYYVSGSNTIKTLYGVTVDLEFSSSRVSATKNIKAEGNKLLSD